LRGWTAEGWSLARPDELGSSITSPKKRYDGALPHPPSLSLCLSLSLSLSFPPRSFDRELIPSGRGASNLPPSPGFSSHQTRASLTSRGRVALRSGNSARHAERIFRFIADDAAKQRAAAARLERVSNAFRGRVGADVRARSRSPIGIGNNRVPFRGSRRAGRFRRESIHRYIGGTARLASVDQTARRRSPPISLSRIIRAFSRERVDYPGRAGLPPPPSLSLSLSCTRATVGKKSRAFFPAPDRRPSVRPSVPELGERNSAEYSVERQLGTRALSSATPITSEQ